MPVNRRKAKWFMDSVETSDLSETVERLKKSKAAEDAIQHSEGVIAGALWAKKTAEYSQLSALAEGRNVDDFRDGEAAAQFAELIGEDTADEFWFDILDENYNKKCTVAFIEGFADGALEVWRAVEPEL